MLEGRWEAGRRDGEIENNKGRESSTAMGRGEGGRSKQQKTPEKGERERGGRVGRLKRRTREGGGRGKEAGEAGKEID